MGYYAARAAHAAQEQLNAEYTRLQVVIQRLQADTQILEAENRRLRTEIIQLQDELAHPKADIPVKLYRDVSDDEVYEDICPECKPSIPESFDRPMYSVGGFGCNQCSEATMIGGDETDQYPLSDCCNPLWEDPRYEGQQLRLLCRHHLLKALVE